MELTVDYQGKMRFKAVCGNHEVLVDLPEESGGGDSAATPPQLFLTSLASCVGVYVAGYCDTAGINSQGMRIKIRADKLLNPARLDNIGISIIMPNAEVGKRREAILAVAKKCLIHNTIASHPNLQIELDAK